MSGPFDNNSRKKPVEIVDPAQLDKRVGSQLLMVLFAAVAPFLVYKIYLVVIAGGSSREELFSFAWIVACAAIVATLAGRRLRAFVACSYARMTTLLRERENELGVARETLAEQERNLLAAMRRLEALAQCDPLTGLASRRRFDEYLQEQWTAMIDRSDGMAMISLTIDHFRLFNDNYGRPAGDRCLRDVAEVLALAALRQQDMAARCCSEEFCILLPGLPPHQLETVAEFVRSQVYERNIPRDDTPLGRVTVSVGAAFLYPEEHGSPEFLRVAAEQALHEATKRGRNACAVRSDLVPARQNYGSGLRVAL